MREVRVAVLYGFGINCNNETVEAYRMAGASPEQVLLNDLVSGRKELGRYAILDLPGGFADGDDLGAAKVWAVRLKYQLRNQLGRFREEGKLIKGTCNGYQALAKAGLLPGLEGEYGTQTVTLAWNDSGRFRDDWIHLKGTGRKCVWTEGIEGMELPVRHGEGKFVPGKGVLERLYRDDLVVFKYVSPEGEENPGFPWNPNGSVDGIAGICDPSGKILGMMPHPEAFVIREQHPDWTRAFLPEEGQGLQIFRNGVEYARKNL